MENTQLKYNSLVQRLQKVISKQKLYDNIYFIFAVLAVFLTSFSLVSLIEYFIHSGENTRKVLFYTPFLISIISAVFFYIKTNKTKSTESNKVIEISKKVGDYFPQIKDKLTNAIQIFSQISISKGISNDLAQHQLSIISDKTSEYNFEEVIETKRYKKIFLILFIVSISSLATFILPNIALNNAFDRVVNYNQSFIPSPNFEIFIEKDKYQVMRGEDFSIKIKSKGASPESIALLIKEENQETFENVEIKKSQNGEYLYKINSIKNSLVFYGLTPWYNSEVQTEIATVIVSERPNLKKLTGLLDYPNYTGEKTKSFEINTADLVALNGSIASFNLEANKNLKSAELVFVTQKQDTVETTQLIYDTLSFNVDANIAKGRMRLTKSGYYYFSLIDSNDIRNINPIKYSVIVTNDNNPKIDLLYPKDNVKLTENALVQIDAEISDDYGFTKLNLNYKLLKSRYTDPDLDYKTQEILINKNKKEQIATYIFDMNEISITPEDEYEFYLEVFDNDIVNGPKSAKTRTIKLKLPSLDEVIESSEKAQEEIEKDLAEVIKETTELQKEIEEFKQDLRKDAKKQEMNYEQKKQAKDIAKKQKDISESIDKLQKKISKTAQEMNENKVLSPETLEKFMKLQDLLNQVDIPQLKQMQEKMNKELEKMTPDEMQKALENMKFDEEQFKKSIERSMKILERMKAEQKTDAIKKMGEKLEKDLQNLEKETSKSKNEETNKQLEKKQKKLLDDFKKLDEQMSDLEKMLSKQEDMPKDKLNEAKDALNKENTQQQMQQSQQNLSQNKNSEAQKNQQNAKQNMSKFNQKMSELKQEMENKVSRETLNAMKKSVQDMLNLSKKQEQLKNQTNASNYNSNQLPEINNEQGNLKESLERVAKNLTELSEKSFAVTPQMGQQIGKAMAQMQNAMNQLAERNTRQAGKSQQESMARMNNAIGQMQESIGQMQGQGKGKGKGKGQGKGSGGSSPGMSNSPGGSGFMQQLQQAAAQQQMINNSLKKMMQKGQNGKEGSEGQGDGKSQLQKQAEYGRLKGEQGNAKKTLEDLAEEQKEYSKQSGKKTPDLKEIAKEMQEVMSDIESGNITPETLERQEKILSRLLDATRATNERDYEKKREAKSGTQYSLDSPEALEFEEYLKTLSEEELRNSLKLDYSKDIKDLIRSYFDKLNKSN
ncbi:MAG: DUF4175 family protein [Chlorobiota bacterium]